MELNILFEVFNGPMAKVKKLKAFLTPELLAKNHELIIDYIASKSSLSDIDELAVHMTDGFTDADEVKFILELLQKKLKSIGCTNISVPTTSKDPHIRADIFSDQLEGGYQYREHVIISYLKGKWNIMHWPYTLSSTGEAIHKSDKTYKVDSEMNIAPIIQKLQKSAVKRLENHKLDKK